MKFAASSARSERAGLTLVEVVASLGLLSTLLVGMLVAFSRHADLIARHRLADEAVTATEAMLYTWQAEGVAVPRSGGGVFEGEGKEGEGRFRWQVRSTGDESGSRLGIETVRLEVFGVEDGLDSAPLLTLDLARPALTDTTGPTYEK